MRNQEISRGLRLFAEGFNALANAFESTDEVKNFAKEVIGSAIAQTPERPIEVRTATTTSEPEVSKPVEEKPVATKVKEVEEPIERPEMTKEDLEVLSYKDIQNKAKDLGLKAVGTKANIINAILEAVYGSTEDSKEEDNKEVAEKPKAPEKTVKQEEIEEPEDVEEDDTPEAPEEDSAYDVIAKDLEEYSDVELANVLSEVGISPKGRRQALIAKIVQAIEDGKIDWSTDEDTEDSQEPVEPDNQEDDGEEEYDYVTEARKQTCLEIQAQVNADFKAKKLTSKDMITFLKQYDPEYISQGAEADLEDYIYLKMNLVDEEGNTVDFKEPYYIGDNIFCCGAELESVTDGFKCSICSQEYAQ